MDVDLAVFNPNGDFETSFGDFVFSHPECGAMTQHQNPATFQYTLRCNCGLAIHFDDMGDAYNNIVDAVIDGLPRQLPDGSYVSKPTSVVRVVPLDAA